VFVDLGSDTHMYVSRIIAPNAIEQLGKRCSAQAQAAQQMQNRHTSACT